MRILQTDPRIRVPYCYGGKILNAMNYACFFRSDLGIVETTLGIELNSDQILAIYNRCLAYGSMTLNDVKTSWVNDHAEVIKAAFYVVGKSALVLCGKGIKDPTNMLLVGTMPDGSYHAMEGDRNGNLVWNPSAARPGEIRQSWQFKIEVGK